MKIIVDTNLWISFLIGKKLSALEILLKKSNLSIYVCDELTNELKNVALRDKIRKYITETDIIDILELIDAYCNHTTISITAESLIRDAKDLYLLSLADTVMADYILTGDKDLLVLQKHNQTTIITYSEFMIVLGINKKFPSN